MTKNTQQDRTLLAVIKKQEGMIALLEKRLAECKAAQRSISASLRNANVKVKSLENFKEEFQTLTHQVIKNINGIYYVDNNRYEDFLKKERVTPKSYKGKPVNGFDKEIIGNVVDTIMSILPTNTPSVRIHTFVAAPMPLDKVKVYIDDDRAAYGEVVKTDYRIFIVDNSEVYIDEYVVLNASDKEYDLNEVDYFLPTTHVEFVINNNE